MGTASGAGTGSTAAATKRRRRAQASSGTKRFRRQAVCKAQAVRGPWPASPRGRGRVVQVASGSARLWRQQRRRHRWRRASARCALGQAPSTGHGRRERAPKSNGNLQAAAPRRAQRAARGRRGSAHSERHREHEASRHAKPKETKCHCEYTHMRHVSGAGRGMSRARRATRLRQKPRAKMTWTKMATGAFVLVRTLDVTILPTLLSFAEDMCSYIHTCRNIYKPHDWWKLGGSFGSVVRRRMFNTAIITTVATGCSPLRLYSI